MPEAATTAAAATTATTAAATETAAAATAATTAAATHAVPWLGEAPEEIVGYSQLKGWKSAADAVSSYQNLEKLLGADRAGRTVVIPSETATPAEIEAFQNKLGRPTEPTGYKLQVPEGQTKEFADTASKWFHEAGLTAKQAEVVNAKWNEHVATLTKAQADAAADKLRTDKEALSKEWGAAHEQNLQLAQHTRAKLGVSDEEVDGIAQVLGLKRTIEMFHKLGQRTGESDFVAGDKTTGFGDALTPAAAKAKITELRSDKEFIKRYMNKDSAAVAEMKRLHQMAAGK